MRKIGLYIRVAATEIGSLDSPQQKQKLTLERHVRKMNRAQPGWGDLVGTYIDAPASGLSPRRKRLQGLLTDVRHGKIDTVLVTDLARISRSSSQLMEVINFFAEQKCSLISLHDNAAVSTQAAVTFNKMMASLALGHIGPSATPNSEVRHE